MVRIAISQAAFDAIAATLPGNVGYENATNEKGERLVWLDRAVVDRLRALRGFGEDYSDGDPAHCIRGEPMSGARLTPSALLLKSASLQAAYENQCAGGAPA
jgi:hypothetical protein